MTDTEFYVLDSIGVVVARGAVDERTIDGLNACIDDRIGDAEVAKFRTLDLGDVFMELMTHPWIVAVCTRLIGDRFRFDHAFGVQQPNTLPNLHGGPQACHDSCFYHAIPSSAGAAHVGRLSVGIALTRQTKATGGFAYVPGSHKSNVLMHGSTVLSTLLNGNFEHECIHVPTLNPGDVCVFPDCLVHGTAPWKETYRRRALYYMYSPGYMAWKPYAEVERYAALAKTKLQRQLLRPPYVASSTEDWSRLGVNAWRPSTTDHS